MLILEDAKEIFCEECGQDFELLAIQLDYNNPTYLCKMCAEAHKGEK